METKVAIMIVAYNNANLTIPMAHCIRKYCKDPNYDILVIDNSDKGDVQDFIKYYALNNGCIYMKTKASSSNGSQSHSFAITVGFQKYAESYTHFLFLDHDNFPIKDFSVVELLKDKVIAGLGQQNSTGLRYFWAGAFCVDLTKVDPGMVDFSPNHDLKLDTGGNLYRIIEKFGEDKCIFWNEAYHQNPNFNKSQYQAYAVINDEMFMHFVNASGWNPTESNDERINTLLSILKLKTGIE